MKYREYIFIKLATQRIASIGRSRLEDDEISALSVTVEKICKACSVNPDDDVYHYNNCEAKIRQYHPDRGFSPM